MKEPRSPLNWRPTAWRGLALIVLALVSAAAANYLRPEPLAWGWRPPPPVLPVIDNLGDLKAALAAPETVLVDARDEFLYRMGRIPGAVNLPPEQSAPESLEKWRAALPPEAHIIIYCSDEFCSMAEELGEKMTGLGLAPHIFTPGFDQWELQGQAIEGEAAGGEFND